MSKQFLETLSKHKSKRQQLDDYLTYSPRSKKRSFYTRYHIAEGKDKLDDFVQKTAIESVDKHADEHRNEIRQMLGEQRQQHFIDIEELFRTAKYDVNARYPYFNQYIGQYHEDFYNPYKHLGTIARASDKFDSAEKSPGS